MPAVVVGDDFNICFANVCCFRCTEWSAGADVLHVEKLLIDKLACFNSKYDTENEDMEYVKLTHDELAKHCDGSASLAAPGLLGHTILITYGFFCFANAEKLFAYDASTRQLEVTRTSPFLNAAYRILRWPSFWPSMRLGMDRSLS
jgi:hypothetical protein